jgi:predicted lipid-binding transport protein (Tim44 family)
MRGLAGGLVGGMIGSMLFGGLGHAGGGSFGGGGIGLFDILLIGGGLYLLWRYLKKRKAQEQAQQSGYQAGGYQQDQGGSSYQDTSAGGQAYAPPPPPPPPPPGQDTDQGLAHIRAMDPGFDPRAFVETVSDIFFQVQAAWGKRALEPIRGLLTEEMFGVFTKQVQDMAAQGRTNKLENVSVRSVEVTEAWQEQGSDYITVRFFANLLDYTVDDKSGQVISGSDSIPVKFEEYWTFARPVGPNPWRLTAVTQVQ